MQRICSTSALLNCGYKMMNYLQPRLPMLANLPMYDFPEVRDATDGFWVALAKAYGVRFGLTRTEDWTAPWRDPNLLFSQTCGYPFTHDFDGILTYVATPHYAADGCDGPNYSSIILARSAAPLESFRGRTAAFNNRDSMSGMLALQLVFAPLAINGVFFGSTVETGGHLASLAAVQQGRAEICAVDCVTIAFARRYRPAALDGLTEVARSPSVPGLPFVTRSGDVGKLRSALHQVMNDPSTDKLRESLLVTGLSVLPPGGYDIIPNLERAMQARGGLKLWSSEMDAT
jgi:ABC-type phosphate/phosphonate transport system substrate-binding protein